MAGSASTLPPLAPQNGGWIGNNNNNNNNNDNTTQQEQKKEKGWKGNNKDTLIVVATLITTLSYQMGTNIPGGYWEKSEDGHDAGDPIMRDRHRVRYWMFMTSSWTGFASSMLMTICLLADFKVNSMLVRWPFLVAYSSLVLNFILTQMMTHLEIDLAVWVAVLLVLWLIVRHSRGKWPFRSNSKENNPPTNI